MAFYARQGRLPEKRHTQFRAPGGALYAEELISTKGFESVYSLAYHLRPPTATLDVQPWERPLVRFLPNDPVRNRHWFTGREKKTGDAVEARVPLVGNDDIVLSTAGVTERMEYFFRNSGGDEMLYVTHGEGVLESAFGNLAYRAHDYLYVPMGTAYRLQPSAPTDAAGGRVVGPDHDPAQVPQRVRPARRARAVLRARLPRAGAATTRSTRWASSSCG